MSILVNVQREYPDMGSVSDGYHTFNELYEFRTLYNAEFFNYLSLMIQEYGIDDIGNRPVKSKRHSDGELCYGGSWFIVVTHLRTGWISNHYQLKDWDLFQIDEVEKAPEFDGHTSKDVLERLRADLERTS